MSMNPDQSMDRLLKFAKNHRPSGGFSNMYLIQKKDSNGDLVDEFYGMNMMTDYGMKRWFVDKVGSFPVNLYVGQGTGMFDYTSQVLNEKIPDVGAATNSNTTVDYGYPMYFDPVYGTEETGLITCMCRYLVAYYDYSVSSNNGPFAISEYGLGENIDALWTHSWVYDQNGVRTQVTKKLNERLEITVYLCYSYYEYLITSNWEKGIYTTITTMEAFINKMREDKIYTYKRNAVRGERGLGTATTSLFEGNKITNSRVVNSFTMYQGGDATSGYFDGFQYYRKGFNTLEPIMLDHEEDIEINKMMSNQASSYAGFSDKFGHTSHPYYFSQIDVKSVNLFNHKATGSNKWTNACAFHNTANHWYDETSLAPLMAEPIYYSNNNAIVGMWLYQNLRTDDPIIKLNGAVSTVYATNKYWDVSSWEQVIDFNNLSPYAQTARYWITSSNTVGIEPLRRSDVFYLRPNGIEGHGYINYNDFAEVYGARSYCDNIDYGWYLFGNMLYFVGHSGIRSRTTLGESSQEAFTYGKYLVICDNNASQFLLADASKFASDGVSGVRTTPLFSANTNTYTECYRSHSDTGILCFQSLKASEANVISMLNGSFKQILLNAKFAVCIWGTNKIAYVPADDATHLKVYDVETESDTATVFDIPDGITSITFMFAHTKYIWMTNGSTYNYLFNIDDGTIVGSSNTMLYPNNQRYVKYTAVDDAVVIYRYDQYNAMRSAVCIDLRDPANTYTMSDFINTDTSYYNSRCDYTLRYVDSKNLQSGGIGKSLILLATRGYTTGSNNGGSENYVYDFGQYLHDKTISHWPMEKDNNLACYFFYGENIIYRSNRQIPAINFLPIKVNGTSKSVGTQNKIKNVSGAQYHIEFGNIPVYGLGESDGKPPGRLN